MEKEEKSKFQDLIKNVGTGVIGAKDFWIEAEKVFKTKMTGGTSGKRGYVIRKLKESGQLEVAGYRRGTMYSIKSVAQAIKYFEELKEDEAEKSVFRSAPVKVEPSVSALSKAKEEQMKYIENVLRMLRYCVRQNCSFIAAQDLAEITKHVFVNKNHVLSWISQTKAAGIEITSPEIYESPGKATKYEFRNFKYDLITICDEGHRLFPGNFLFDAVKAFGGGPDAEEKVKRIRWEMRAVEKAPTTVEQKLDMPAEEEKIEVEIIEKIVGENIPESHTAPAIPEADEVPIKIQEMTLNDLLAKLGKLKIQITISL